MTLGVKKVVFQVMHNATTSGHAAARHKNARFEVVELAAVLCFAHIGHALFKGVVPLAPIFLHFSAEQVEMTVINFCDLGPHGRVKVDRHLGQALVSQQR